MHEARTQAVYALLQSTSIVISGKEETDEL
jgi:hypothetical protein